MRTETKKMSRLINRTELLYRVAIGWPTIDKRIAQGTFPPGRKVGTKWLWLESDVEAYIAGTWTAPRVKAEVWTMKDERQRPVKAVRDMHQVHQYAQLNEQELASLADVKNPNRFQRRAIATYSRGKKAPAAANSAPFPQKIIPIADTMGIEIHNRTTPERKVPWFVRIQTKRPNVNPPMMTATLPTC
jgi:predicted DNA-binding transcriptional regulator AlpA